MKKILLIVLVMCFVVSTGIVALAKVEFGDWDKWDEQLPPKNSKSWHWVWPSKEPVGYTIKGFGVSDDDITILSLDLYYGRKFDMKAVSVCFYFSGDVGVNNLDWYISNAVIALAAFPPKEKKITIRAYKTDKTENNIFKFFEEWEIEYEVFKRIGSEVVISSQSRFIQEFKKWLGSISSFSPEDISENLLNLVLPKILVSDENFIISTKEVYVKE